MGEERNEGAEGAAEERSSVGGLKVEGGSENLRERGSIERGEIEIEREMKRRLLLSSSPLSQLFFPHGRCRFFFTKGEDLGLFSNCKKQKLNAYTSRSFLFFKDPTEATTDTTKEPNLLGRGRNLRFETAFNC